MVLSLLVPLLVRFASLNLSLIANPQWTEDDLKTFVHFWLLNMNTYSCGPTMFLLYHSEGCDIYGRELS